MTDPDSNHTDPSESEREILLGEYSEVCSNIRSLLDIRLKLLTLLPIAAAVAIALNKESAGVINVGLSLFGLFITIGLVIYNTRNDQLYDELMHRAADIERSLNITDGAFAFRPRGWFRVKTLGRSLTVDHRAALSLLYGASIALWLSGVLVYLGRAFVGKPSTWIDSTAIVSAILLTYLGHQVVERQRTHRMMQMRNLANEAVKTATGMTLLEAANDTVLLEMCAELADISKQVISARATYNARVADYKRLLSSIPDRPANLYATYLVALLTDSSPRWIYDTVSYASVSMENQQVPEKTSSRQPGE